MGALAYESNYNDEFDGALTFGDVCLSCGGPSQGLYCSSSCRAQDSEQSSPHSANEDLPQLMSSGKSSCSSTPSSPSPRGVMTEDLGPEPPTLALPGARKGGFFGGHSLPTLPSGNWAIKYGRHEEEVQEDKARDTQLVYHRKGSKPSIPAPLYYRERAAIIHSSPALAPSSPSARRVTPPSFWSPQLTSTKAIPDLDLAPSVAPVPNPPLSTTNCGRPGCVGIPSRPRIDDVQYPKDSHNRRKSWTSAPAGALKPLSVGDSSDLLMSPRIRALRASEGALGLVEPLDDSEFGDDEGGDDGQHSAFACYLFSQLADKTAPAVEQIDEMVRGRSAGPTSGAVDQRSMSVDAAALASRNSSSSSTPSRGRPTRFLFARGSPAPAPAATEEPIVDHNATIRAPTTSTRAPLTAGHFISATVASSVSGVSPFPSPPPSPPTAGRGRSTTRDAAPAALERSLSRPRESRSRGRQASGVVVERDSRSSSRRASSGRESRPPRESRGRGRLVDEDVVEEEEDRGRGRARSRSLLRRGMGREVAISGAAYGHFD